MFGSWRLCNDTNHHYFLNGASLCGKRVKDSGEPLLFKIGEGSHSSWELRVDLNCKNCTARNVIRWAAGGEIPVDEAAQA
jgi:hypothetical protein